MASERSETRLTGEAAWKAQLAAVEEHNVAAKQRAREKTAAAGALTERERRLAAQEEVQLRALNARLGNRV